MKKLFFLFLFLSSVLFAKVNINTATKHELMSLKGVGSKTAEMIINYRKDHPFKNISDIKNIKGFGEKKFEKIKDEISINGPTEISKQAKMTKKVKEMKNKVEEKGKKVAKKIKKGSKKVKKATKNAVNKTKEKVKDAVKK